MLCAGTVFRDPYIIQCVGNALRSEHSATEMVTEVERRVRANDADPQRQPTRSCDELLCRPTSSVCRTPYFFRRLVREDVRKNVACPPNLFSSGRPLQVVDSVDGLRVFCRYVLCGIRFVIFEPFYCDCCTVTHSSASGLP